jgi:hypothetical protein
MDCDSDELVVQLNECEGVPLTVSDTYEDNDVDGVGEKDNETLGEDEMVTDAVNENEILLVGVCV